LDWQLEKTAGNTTRVFFVNDMLLFSYKNG